MSRVSCFSDTSSLAPAAIVLAKYGPQPHIGIICKQANAPDAEVVHLAGHHRLQCDRPRDWRVIISINVDPIRLRLLAAMCRKIVAANGKHIPYAFSYPNDCFDRQTGQFLLGESVGLTCATFVLAVFHAVGMQLIDYESWPQRAEDTVWQQDILERIGSADRVRHEILASQIGSVRFRPPEVAAAASMYPPKLRFEEIGEALVVVEAALDACPAYQI